MTTRGFDRRPYFSSNHCNDHYRHRAPPPPYVVDVLLLRLSKERDPKPLNSRAIDDLIASIPSSIRPERPLVFPSGFLAAKLPFRCRKDALSAVSFLWRRRINGAHFLLPKIDPNRFCSVEELQCVKQVFVSHIKSLLEGEVVNRCKWRAEEVERRIRKQAELLRVPRRLNLLIEMQEEKKRLEVELEQINARLAEFTVSMRSLLSYLGGNEWKDLDCEGNVEVFKFRKDLDLMYLATIQAMVMRECRRLIDGLPIYAWRRKVLQATRTNQVMVLIGETGSGKSTQLVQFIADSGLVSAGSVVCTQPRKIAAISVAQRVMEESSGCYADGYVSTYPTYSSSQGFASGIIFMTDHCLLQHYIGRKNFEGISYIIVDEAHERSLNTDLLLALIKKELLEGRDLRLIIMSATADAKKFVDYFYGCGIVYVQGRNFPVEIKYVDDVSSEAAWSRVPKLISAKCAPFVSDVIMMVSVIHRTEEDGAILAFLTSQMEVEWACDNFSDPSAVILPLHGKLSHEDQIRVMQNYLGKRKVIFSTNLAETSLTIPGVKYVVDSGMVKDSRFEASTGMNVLKVCRISQSSANQRTGRAGRTGPGKCYRLYSESDFLSMKLHQEPEICKVHLGVAVLRILALDIKNIQDFNFVDSPDPKAIEKAVQNLVQLGAIITKDGVFELTDTGRHLVKLGIEPRLGKIILDSFDCGLRKEGLVLASVMANSSSIFCRVGSVEDKHRADCLKVPFCHRDGDLFTMLSVYKAWEEIRENRNRWCWDNCINAKSMRRCEDTVRELENCLRQELNTIVPSYWYWDPQKHTEYDKLLKKIILSSLIENVAMHSGSEQLGYEVALSGQQLQLHPSCSLLVYGEKPGWVVFGEILAAASQYLVCVNAVDYNDLLKIPQPLFDVTQLGSRKVSMNIIFEVGSNLLGRFCGKYKYNLQSIISHIKEECMDSRISISVDFDRREIQIVAAANNMEKVSGIVADYLEREKKWLRDECTERSLFYRRHGTSPSVALFGSGAEIKHLELAKRYLTVEIFHPIANLLNDKELLLFVEQYVLGIASFFKQVGSGPEGADLNKWGRLTFLSPESAEKAVAMLNEVEFHGSLLKVVPVLAGDHKTVPLSAIRATVCWPRRRSKGCALIQCAEGDAQYVVEDCIDLSFGGQYPNCEVSSRCRDCIFVSGIPRDVSESEIYGEFTRLTRRKILGVDLFKSPPVPDAPKAACEEALEREISSFLPGKNYASQNFQVEMSDPRPKDHVVRCTITFSGSLHFEAAKALDHLQGKVLNVPGCQPWQKINCSHVFYSSVFCPARVYHVIQKEINFLLESFQQRKGVTCTLEKTNTGSYRIKVSANATKIVADLRKPLEQLTRGQTVAHPGLTPSVLSFLLSHDGIQLLRSVERDTGTYILYDRRNLNVRLFGSPCSVAKGETKLINELLSFHEKKPLDVRLRNDNLPPNLMKEIVQKFGADLHGFKEQIPGEVELSLNTRHHILYVRGSKEQKQKAKEIVSKLACSLEMNAILSSSSLSSKSSSECPICLCELEEPYNLELCGHGFCRSCLVEQCESVARSRDQFPLCCIKAGCNQPFLLVDLKSVLPNDKLEELFRASIVSFVASSDGLHRFCPSPDCPSVYRVSADPSLFVCGACSAETCTRCHLEYHPFISCEMYKEFKDEPDKSLKEWRKGKEHVKDCPSCGHAIEKVEGCNHMECKCGNHICWVCLECFKSSDDCYAHLRSENHA